MAKYKVTITGEVDREYLGELEDWTKIHGYENIKTIEELLLKLNNQGEYNVGEYDNLKIIKAEIIEKEEL